MAVIHEAAIGGAVPTVIKKRILKGKDTRERKRGKTGI